MVEGTHTLHSLGIDEGLLSRMEATTVTPVSDIHVSVVDEVAIILNLDSGEYHTLNPVGQFVWKLLVPDNTLSTIQSAMCSKYGISKATAKEDLFDLVTQLCRSGLVQLSKK